MPVIKLPSSGRNIMVCKTCDHTMQSVVAGVFWCPRCGSLKREFYDGDHPEHEEPKIVHRTLFFCEAAQSASEALRAPMSRKNKIADGSIAWRMRAVLTRKTIARWRATAERPCGGIGGEAVSKHFCTRCKKEITDGRDEEECIKCGADLCFRCFHEEWVCPACEHEANR